MQDKTYRLRALRGTQQIVLPLGESFVGRDSECTLCIQDSLMSRRHARFFADVKSLSIEDLNSTNGTEVNYSRIQQKTPLKSGDVISFGEHAFQVVFPGMEDATVLPNTKNLGQNSYIVQESLGSKTALRQSFSLPSGWSSKDSSQFASGADVISQLIEKAQFDRQSTLAVLVITSGEFKNSVMPLTKKSHVWVVGRSERSDICIAEVTLSQQHAAISFNGKDWAIKDLQSRNGTFINSKKITESSLTSSDVVKFGNISAVFRIC